ncbi:MAG: hypothetical protein NTW52_12185 [Planctomycetota bacterium]|nr:hypothetical protein [Planctomycetota bacterium]
MADAVETISKIRVEGEVDRKPSVADVVGNLPENFKKEVETIRSTPVTLEARPPLTAKDVLVTGFEDAKRDIEAFGESINAISLETPDAVAAVAGQVAATAAAMTSPFVAGALRLIDPPSQR